MGQRGRYARREESKSKQFGCRNEWWRQYECTGEDGEDWRGDGWTRSWTTVTKHRLNTASRWEIPVSLGSNLVCLVFNFGTNQYQRPADTICGSGRQDESNGSRGCSSYILLTLPANSQNSLKNLKSSSPMASMTQTWSELCENCPSIRKLLSQSSRRLSLRLSNENI